MENYTYVTTATNTSSAVVPFMVTYGGAGGNGGGGGGGAGGYVNWAPPPAATPQGPLEWLDGEIERTCALARPKIPAA